MITDFDSMLRLSTAELIAMVEDAGYSVSGPIDHSAAKDGEPVWVCNARDLIADTSTNRGIF